MLQVPRLVRKQNDPSEHAESNQPLELAEFRAERAWVLLGEPGAGKSTALKNEAEQTGGQYLRIDEFIDLDPDPAWQGKTLFLDGLDEVRASGARTRLLLQLRNRLCRLGKPPFRIACRAADWNGAADRDDLNAATADGKINVLSLEPLSENDILAILQSNLEISDAAAFVASAGARGVADLLTNPQTLEMLAKAIRGSDWPGSRDDTYRLACEKLAEEHNKQHRLAKRDKPVPVDQILDAAGQLCAVMLLADRNGVATELAGASERFPVLEDFSPPDLAIARQAIGSKLFRPDDIEERLQPVHRSVAEYLAARWLGKQIDDKSLPLPRLLTLLLGADGGVVAGLRGLFAWLAVHCLSVRQRLIEADPLTVVIYGDVKPMSPSDKRAILQGLRREAEKFAGFRGGLGESHRFGALADPALFEDLREILQAPERDDASQSMVHCVLDALDTKDGVELSGLAQAVLEVVRDDSYRSWFRTKALNTWLRWATPGEALALLEAVRMGHVVDADDELAGALLTHLYPAGLGPERLLDFLHAQKKEAFTGSYRMFWIYHLPEQIPDEHLQVVLDCITGQVTSTQEIMLGPHWAGKLVAKGLERYGTEITAERLHAWLGIATDEYGNVIMEEAQRDRIAAWFRAHPERYKEVLAICYRRSEEAEQLWLKLDAELRLLERIPKPDDLGRWHLLQASQTTKDEFIQEHLQRAIIALRHREGDAGLSREDIENWAGQDTARGALLQPHLPWETSERRQQQAIQKVERIKVRDEAKRLRTQQIAPHLVSIANGSASAGVMHQLARVWKGHYSDVTGETPLARFTNYADDNRDLFDKTAAGFRLCPERADLPSSDNIVDWYLEQKEPLIGLPCLIGMDLRWQAGADQIESLPETALTRMLMMWLTRGEDSAPWVKYLAASRPSLFTEALLRYAGRTLRAGHDRIDGIPLLDEQACNAAARLALPQLLKSFPSRAFEAQTRLLGRLLKLALRIVPEELAMLCSQKLGLVSKLNVAQAVHWYAAAMLLDSNKADALWAYVGNSAKRCSYLADFLGERFGSPRLDRDLAAPTLGKLIELIAPHAEMEWVRQQGGYSDACLRGDQIRAYIDMLAGMGNEAAAQEIARLLALPSMRKLRWYLENARHQQAIRHRESSFRFPTLREAAEVLRNGAPASHADLAALVLDHLDQIAYEIQHENDDGYASFWNVENKKPVSHREENRCRDELLRRLRARLDRLGISCEPEADYVRDKRADIQVSYRNEFKLPIEIKGYWHEELWTALRSQLIAQYTTAPLAGGFGVYLILWFGRDDAVPLDENGRKLASICMRHESGKKPTSPQELQQRLEAQLDSTERDRVFVRVLDVSWR